MPLIMWNSFLIFLLAIDCTSIIILSNGAKLIVIQTYKVVCGSSMEHLQYHHLHTLYAVLGAIATRCIEIENEMIS